jgi:hypothetical protein
MIRMNFPLGFHHAFIFPVNGRSIIAARHSFRRVARMVLFLLIPVLLVGAPQPLNSMRPMSVNDYAVQLPGERPASPIDPSGYISVPYSAALNPNGGSITIEAWVKRNAYNRHETLLGNGFSNSYWLGFNTNGRLGFCPHGSASCVEGATIIPSDIWTHLAVTYDGTTRKYYINGVLKTISADNPGPITPAPPDHSLGIGFDPDDLFLPNFYGGWIDNLRIWSVARSSHEIRGSMFASLGEAYPGLLAEWHFDGDAQDLAGGHDGVLVGNVTFGNEGALPRDIRIPLVSLDPLMDGSCESDEYGDAALVTIDDTPVHLLRSENNLWACFDDLGLSGKSAALYLDAHFTRLNPPQVEHLRLEIRDTNETYAFEGDGEGGWVETTQADGLWEAQYKVSTGTPPRHQAEFRIDLNLLCGEPHVLGLALEKTSSESTSSYASTASDKVQMWPALAHSFVPGYWSALGLDDDGSPSSFSGRVVYQPTDEAVSPYGTPGVSVNLFGSVFSGGTGVLVSTGKSNLDGSFHLESNDNYSYHHLELGTPPKGYIAKEASAPSPGVALDARTLDYGNAPAGSYPANLFILGDALPYPMDLQTGPYFLILASESIITSGSLDEFRDFKLRQGFEVAIVSIERVDTYYPGSNRIEKIRQLELERLSLYGSRFRYMLLVGPDNLIPFARFVICFDGKEENGIPLCISPAAGDSLTESGDKLKLSDWPYVDPTSDFDSNGNGCLLDGVASYLCNVVPVAGYTPDAKPAFQPTISVGRIPFNTPQAVETALKNSLLFEAQSELFKGNVLHAMSMYTLKGQYWTPLDVPPESGGHAVPCPNDIDNTSSKECEAATGDGANLAEQMKADTLNPREYESVILYEAVKPEGACPVYSPTPLTHYNVTTTLSTTDYGLVNLAGHGGPSGVARTHWVNLNTNSIVDSPTEPLPFTSVNEIKYHPLLNKYGLGTLAPAGAKAAVFQTIACSTGSGVTEDSFGATLLEDGHGVAFLGALSIAAGAVAPSVTQRLMGENHRLGDSLWQALSYYALTGFTGSTELDTDLFGDPTLSYWGNPGGQTTLAAWPMLRYDARGQGFTSLAGPQVPKKLWDYTSAGPAAGTLLPSPVVSNNGEVIVAHSTYVDVLRAGVLYQRLYLDAGAFGTPALSADGTIYALDVNGKLYAFPYQSDYFEEEFHHSTMRVKRWAIDAVSSPSTSPIVNSDGFISVGGLSKVVLVRQDGYIRYEYAVPGSPIGAIVASADQSVYVATDSGYFARLDFFCPGTFTCVTKPGLMNTNYSTPPLLAYDGIYVGMQDGDVLKLDPISLELQAYYQAGSAISAGPIAGPSGQVLIGTANGTLYSLTSDLQFRWQVNLGVGISGVPAYSADALYVVHAERLHAYAPNSGDLLWTRDLGKLESHGSVAVGYGREVYVQSDLHNVYAFGEGWPPPPVHLELEAVATAEEGNAVRLQWYPVLSPVSENPELAAAPTELGFLIQRRFSDGDWEDLAVVPLDTGIYTDTRAADNSWYAYRVQRLDPSGEDSDFTQALAPVRSLPASPGSPDLLEVTAESATELRLEWLSSLDDIVSKYRIEQESGSTGMFISTVQVSGRLTTTLVSSLEQDTRYTFRVVAVNDTGESAPSNEMSGTTRALSLAAPQDVYAALLEDARVQIEWEAGPEGVETVIEYSELGMDGYRFLGSISPSTSLTHFPGNGAGWIFAPGESNTYQFRLKFVLGSSESPYTQSNSVFIPPKYWLHLPIIMR